MANKSNKAVVANVIAVSSKPSASSTDVGSGSGTSTGSSLGVIPGSGTTAKTGLRTEVTQVVTGMGSQFPTGTSLTVKGVSMTAAQIVAQFASGLSLFAVVDADVQTTKHDRLALEAATPGIRLFLTDVKAALVALFGKGSPSLAAFGFSGKPPKTLTIEQELEKQEKSAQTRQLRGTVGPVKKLETKFQGTVTVQATPSGTAAAAGNSPTANANPGNSGASAGASNTPAAGASPAGPASNTSAS